MNDMRPALMDTIEKRLDRFAREGRACGIVVRTDEPDELRPVGPGPSQLTWNRTVSPGRTESLSE